MGLLDELEEATRAARYASGECSACVTVRAMPPGDTRDALVSALEGTIGARKLAQIIRNNIGPMGKLSILRHREEGHIL